MKLLEEMWLQLVILVVRARHCIGLPYTTSDCISFWRAVSLASVAAGVVGALYVARILFIDYLKYREVRRRRLAELEVASPEIMEKVKWRDEVSSPDLSEAEIAAQIKRELERRKNE